MGKQKATEYFKIPEHREFVNDIARQKTVMAPDRDLNIEQFRKKKWSHSQ